MATDEELLALARTAVPDHLKPLGKVVRDEPTEPVAAGDPHVNAAPPDSFIDELIREVGASPQPHDPSESADVEFVEHTHVGSKATVVQIRNGQVARVIKRA